MNLSEILAYIQIGALLFSVVGAYFFIKYKLKAHNDSIILLQTQFLNAQMNIEKNVEKVKQELEKRYDEKIDDLKKQNLKIESEIKEQLFHINKKLDDLLTSMIKK
jgi:uncharacterized protein YdcH (DUF465 family)